MALAQFAPTIYKLIAGNDQRSDNAQKIVDIAKTVTGTSETNSIDAIKNNSDLQLKFNQQIADLETSLAKTDSANLVQINDTMRAEIASEHVPTYIWRPLIGIAVAFNLAAMTILVFVICVVAVITNHYEIFQYLPQIIMDDAALLTTVLPILGIASYFRGKMQADQNISTINRG